MKTKIFFDMDGVLADIHAEENFYERMHEKGFFARLKAFNHAIQAMKNLNDNPNFDVYILSHSISEQCRREKSRWLDWMARDLPRDRIFIIDIEKSKAEFVSEKFGEFDKTFVLFDDYSKNLIEWEKAGGTAILCENNTAYLRPEYSKWSGKCVSNSNPAEQIIGDLKSAMSEIQNEKTMIFRLYNEVYPEFFKRNFYGDLEEYSEEIPSFEILNQVDELNKIVQKCEKSLNERGLAEYFNDENKSINEKVKSIFQHFEIINDDVVYVTECEIKSYLSESELEELKDYICSQNSDGYGESLEQQGIKIADGELNVSVWSEKSDYKIFTEGDFSRKNGIKFVPPTPVTERFYAKIMLHFFDRKSNFAELGIDGIKMCIGNDSRVEDLLNYIFNKQNLGSMSDVYLNNYADKINKIETFEQYFKCFDGEAFLVSECRTNGGFNEQETANFKNILAIQFESGYGRDVISDVVSTKKGDFYLEMFGEENYQVMTECEFQEMQKNPSTSQNQGFEMKM